MRLAGTAWYFQFFFYTMGESQMGRYGFSSWTLHMASIIIFAALWGLGLREWRGAAGRTKGLLGLGIFILMPPRSSSASATPCPPPTPEESRHAGECKRSSASAPPSPRSQSRPLRRSPPTSRGSPPGPRRPFRLLPRRSPRTSAFTSTRPCARCCAWKPEGTRLRVKLTNELGTTQIKVGAVHVALSDANGVTDPATDRVLTFSGAREAVLRPGALL